MSDNNGQQTVSSLGLYAQVEQENFALVEQLQQRGKPLPSLGTIANLQIEALLDTIYPSGTPLRQTIDMLTARRLNELLREASSGEAGSAA